ncbi:uncharacterized protein LOC115446412 isoform X2 [Manduca sexta]|uniref:Uncharacterized protein n=2 Tax=Manduca sexta TaxID=7130 RepID=A0A921ZAY2_MANSE|nr:uncharacterized protein LOC115446412 isoform X2 [Manduca sexta]XP_037300844.1 uncharacterized protein LOC115446412 isoform X2 [Manduca sexta]KAG6454678.1 hypothetical protein O3G_MSEX008821 [Manduca sexta]
MSRCSGDAFYRVLCLSLLAIAVAFCLVITDVFIDIDGLMRVKKDKIPKLHTTIKPVQIITSKDGTTDKYDNTEINYDMDYSYRTKRSSETQNLLLQMKQSKMKNLLTHRLARLLDQLDAEETTEVTSNRNTERVSIEKSKELKETQKEDIKLRTDDKEDLLHSAMHEILLLGLRGHLDFNEVYDRIHKLTADFDKASKETVKTFRTNAEPPKSEDMKYPRTDLYNERKLFDEILHCKKLQDDITEHGNKLNGETRRKSEVPKIIIKTVIDINSLIDGKRKMENESNSRENVKGLVKLVYNGKSIKFTRIEDEETQTNKNKEMNPKLDTEPIKETPKYDEIADLLSRYTSETKTNYINEYLKNYDHSEIKNTKRLKRHIKIRYENDEVTQKPKKKKDDDELFVEIETHFDGKGMKGDKKKKLISNLVEKIQKAIHLGADKKENKKPNVIIKNDKQKKRRHIHVKKRIQNPLTRDNVASLKNNYVLPYDAIIHRQLNPIAKAVPLQEPLPYVSDKYGQSWNRKYYGPGFLAVTKSINSAEMSEVDVDYNKANINGVSQRIQKPLNNEITEKDSTPNAYYDLGKLKFIMKDIDGSGFSVGFNQYVDEQPDPETMKLFTGLENILQTYHQKYDQTPENEVDSTEKPNEIHEVDYEQNEHTISRRSIQRNKPDHHSNEYNRVIFENDFMPYENYEDIFKGATKANKLTNSHNLDNLNTLRSIFKSRASRFVVDEDIFGKKLNPAEIFGLANLLQRRKRSINVQKISNLKNKIKLNRYLNTKAMATKRIFLNKKRSKRQVDKVRIIATDDLPNIHRHSDEIFVVSDENVLADRAVVREVETPEMEPEKVIEDHYDVISPMAPMPLLEPTPQISYGYEEPMEQPLVTNVFGGRSRHNSLMSKYPHILLEDLARSREEDIVENPYNFNKIPEPQPIEIPVKTTTVATPTISNVPPPKMEEIVKAITPENAKTNYRVTVKILPKNISDLNSGFKEIHTSINKSYNRNGLLYSSLVNVSEISKIVKINKTHEVLRTTTTQSPIITNFRRQQETMNHILRQHKHRIEEQLNHLHKEKERLENLSMKNESEFEEPKQNEIIEVVIPSNPPKVMRLTKEEVSRLALATLMNFNNREITTTTMPTTTTTVIIPFTTESPQIDTERTQIINKMERNENMTNEILKKIDKNTEILQSFLRKLTDKISTPKIENDIKIKDFENMRAFKHIPAPFNQIMPNMEGNGTHVAIPFIYAYQQPYALPVNKPEVPVASVVYHGHIHTNTLNRKQEWPERTAKKEVDDKKMNQTRFFIDELENDYKVIPTNIKKAFSNVRNNTGVQ